MEIIIGREEGARRLHCIADGREFNIGQAGTVPTSVSRKHCKLTVMGENIQIENLKMHNVTFVDGCQVFSKGITSSSVVQLGNDKFTIPIKQILSLVNRTPASNGPVGTQKTKVFSLNYLESVWDEYDRRKFELQQENAESVQKRQVLMNTRMTISSIPVVGGIIGSALSAAMLAKSVKNKNDVPLFQKIRDLDEEFATKYACPNPECGRPFGTQPYRQVKFIKKCPACGCRYKVD